MIKHISALLIILLALFQPAFSEPGAFDIKHLQSLFDQYKRVASYKYARQYQTQMEGDPYFDYLFGVSAIDAGHASEGTFALERVLLIFPDDQVARLELARGYFNLQEYSLARVEFEAVLKTQPPDRVRDTAEAYLDKIRVNESRYLPTHSGFVALSLGNDDNVNAGIDKNASFPLAAVLLADSFGQDDNFTALTGAWTYIHPVSPGWLLESTLSGDLRKNQELDKFDTSTGTLQLGVTHIQAASKYKAELITQQFNLDGDSFRTLNGMNLNWQYTISQQSSFNTSLQYAQLDYPDISVKNSDLITLTLNHTHGFSAFLQPLVFTTLSLGTENAQDSSNPATQSETERDIYSLRVGLILSFSNTLALQTAIGTQNSSYAAAPVLQPNNKREDDYSTADLNLIWAFARKWRLDTSYNYTRNSSNIDIREYERNVFDMTATYTF
jgi:outer membrane protein